MLGSVAGKSCKQVVRPWTFHVASAGHAGFYGIAQAQKVWLLSLNGKRSVEKEPSASMFACCA